MSIPHRIKAFVDANPTTDTREQKWRLKHVDPLIALFEQLAECAPEHVYAWPGFINYILYSRSVCFKIIYCLSIPCFVPYIAWN